MKSSSDKYISRVNGIPRATDGAVIGITLPLDWFSGRDVPSTLIIDLNSADPTPVDSPCSSVGAGLSGKRVVLDPGHGEVEDGVNDPGAENRRLNVNERDLVRKQADMVAASLQAQGASVEIVENNQVCHSGILVLGVQEVTALCRYISMHLTNLFREVRS